MIDIYVTKDDMFLYTFLNLRKYFVKKEGRLSRQPSGRGTGYASVSLSGARCGSASLQYQCSCGKMGDAPAVQTLPSLVYRAAEEKPVSGKVEGVQGQQRWERDHSRRHGLVVRWP